MTNTATNKLPLLAHNTRVYLPDGTVGIASPEPSGDRYSVRQGRRVDTGWTREQLVILGG